MVSAPANNSDNNQNHSKFKSHHLYYIYVRLVYTFVEFSAPCSVTDCCFGRNVYTHVYMPYNVHTIGSGALPIRVVNVSTQSRPLYYLLSQNYSTRKTQICTIQTFNAAILSGPKRTTEMHGVHAMFHFIFLLFHLL